MTARRTIGDLSSLPTSGFAVHGLWFWGGCAFMLIEAAGFSLGGAAYVYTMNANSQWPLASNPPNLFWGTAQTLLLVGSLIPTWFLARVARRRDLAATRWIGLLVLLLNAGAIVIRAFEFPNLNTRWDQDAYGSVTWALILLHTLHLLTDFIDTFFLTVFIFTHPVRTDRFADVHDDAIYWAYVVFTWLPLYLLIYWAPRWGP
jgi:heme/copper-type cytochrome/quinol oxidase subunit 3